MQVSDFCTQVADGIFQVKLPLPFALNIVNVYLLRDGDGWALIDTGLNTAEARAAWEAVFVYLNITPRQITRILLTHMHPDHYGMSGWFQSLDPAYAPPLYMSAREAELARLIWYNEGQMLPRLRVQMSAGGMPAEQVDTVIDGMEFTAQHTQPLPSTPHILEAGGGVTIGARRFTLFHAPGHSDGQLLFYDAADRLMLSGDHVLMKITPNIGVWPDTEPDPLGRFLDSLRGLRGLDVRLALPGHKALITDWRGRIDELLSHHAMRLEHTRAAIADGATIFEA
ncbi:MAG: MBL fold metallo-hydrolase, partial [Anaerolineae bacterium]|nr:MBL fold metallo-hydrolase [Anaerolineae bacterium]